MMALNKRSKPISATSKRARELKSIHKRQASELDKSGGNEWEDYGTGKHQAVLVH